MNDSSTNQRDANFKSRNLSTLEYLQRLNQEWWICNLRRKIYPAREDKRYYDRVANLKRNRIKEICERNDLKSIFDDKQLMKELNKFFMKAGGMPLFEDIKEQDIINYYLPENDCRVFMGMELDNVTPKVKLGRISNFDYNAGIVTVEFNKANEGGETEGYYTITQVSRIF